jgi:hypothetical protein
LVTLLTFQLERLKPVAEEQPENIDAIVVTLLTFQLERLKPVAEEQP